MNINKNQTASRLNKCDSSHQRTIKTKFPKSMYGENQYARKEVGGRGGAHKYHKMLLVIVRSLA